LLTGSGLALVFCCLMAAAQPGKAPEPDPASGIPVPVLPQTLAPSWFEGGHPGADAQLALDTLLNAASQGLDPDDYHAAELAQAFHQASLAPPDPIRMAGLDQALAQALALYLRHLHLGRLTPETLAQRIGVHQAATGFDAQALILRARQAHDLAGALRQAEPRVPQYEPLRQAMNTYRAMGLPSAWQTPLPAPAARSLRPGAAYPGLATLAARLEALGDLAPGAFLPARYEGPLVEAVQRFQARHGLEPDGIIGASTLEQLEVSPVQRARQMALTLERMRWAPWPRTPRAIEVNVPEFMLRAYQQAEEQRAREVLSMRVIVGKALNTRTPLFQEDMRFIEFSPYWNVPPSIARGETLPKLRRDPGYFSQQGFEFVTRDGSVVHGLSGEAIDAVQRGDWRIRQRPGPNNALGDIKFIFPNAQNIYLHHTPTPQLFTRTRRDFSHGCIRIEAPVQLAEFVLQGDPGWTENRITQAMQSGRSQTLRLPEPIPVIITYRTASVEKDGKVHFSPDIYQQDTRLAQALDMP
jgi:murein L,D-transpeptidase YcbB/YkuD